MINWGSSWKYLIPSLFFAVAISAPQLVNAASFAQMKEPAGDTVRLMVKVDPAQRDPEQISILSQAAPDIQLDKVGWEIIEVSAAHAQAVIAELQETQGVVEITPDYPLELAWNPNDPSYGNGTQWSLDKIGAEIAWEFSSGEAITVAVIDSGIDHDHPDLAGRIVPGYNFVDKNSDTTDECGHGTHVAGIVAAETNNAIGVAGIAHQGVIMPIKVIGETCRGSYSRLMQGIIYAVDNGVRVISITSGGGYEHTGLHDALIYARSKGVLVVVAAGNHGDTDPFYPGSFEEAFTVSGTDPDDNKYDKSSFGEQIDISAPAVNILNTYWNKDEGSTYAYMNGTSMAAPHVAAVAALILAIDPKLPLTDLENALITSATDLGDEGWDEIFGAGRVTAWRAVAAVSPAAGNVRLGHYRVPNMDAFRVSDLEVTAGSDSIELTWSLESFASDHSVVVYRSPVPVFEAATDIAEMAASATGAYSDSDVEADQEYTYWLVQVDNDVEIAITAAYSATLADTPAVPIEPNPVAMFIPFLER